MYIRGLIPLNFAELAEAVPIAFRGVQSSKGKHVYCLFRKTGLIIHQGMHLFAGPVK